MKTSELKVGQVMIFTPTMKEFTISLVTEKRVSWWLGFVTKSGWGKNNMKKASTSTRIFQKGLDNGTYIIK